VRGLFGISVLCWMRSALSAAPAHRMKSLNASPSGEPRYRNQVAWARFYLVREGLLDSSRRGVWSLTERGRSTKLSPEQAREVFLKWVHFFQEQRRTKANVSEPSIEQVEGEAEVAADIHSRLIDLLVKLPPAGFERWLKQAEMQCFGASGVN
jgi:restriction endonuclease Mrr